MSKVLQHTIIVSLFLFNFNSVLNCQEKIDWMTKHNFVFLSDYLDHAIFEVRYAGTNNFTGRPVEGYNSTRLVMTKKAAIALALVEKKLFKQGYGLKIYDTYRPQRAVNNFKKWSLAPTDTLTKAVYYPQLDKGKLFQLGYISSRSGHSRGSTIDLTLYHLDSQKVLDMGAPYDFFGEISHHDYAKLTNQQLDNRKLLKETMYYFGYIAYAKEWWHYTLYDEPHPDTYFDFIVD